MRLCCSEFERAYIIEKSIDNFDNDLEEYLEAKSQ